MNRLVIIATLALGGCSVAAEHAQATPWVRQRFHWALAGESIEHVRPVAEQCEAKLRTAVAVPEASVPKAFELWGVQFDERDTERQRECVLSKLRVTRLEYFSQAEADPSR